MGEDGVGLRHMQLLKAGSLSLGCLAAPDLGEQRLMLRIALPAGCSKFGFGLAPGRSGSLGCLGG